MADLAATEARIRHVLAAKNVSAADYWRSRGRERFARELAEDGVPPDDAATLLYLIDAELFPRVTLDEVLRTMKERVTSRDPAVPD
jgi:hypothetical protein